MSWITSLPPFAGVTDFLNGAWSLITFAPLWRSLGWLWLGVILMLAGLFLLAGPRAGVLATRAVTGG